MDIDKLFYKKLFNRTFSHPCDIRFWDGEEVHYGEGKSEFKIIFNEPVSKSAVLEDASLAFGEAYMDNRIEINGKVQKVIESLYGNNNSFINKGTLKKFISNNIKRSKENVVYHYDIGNDFYSLWLDETMTYSCGYFKTNEDTLNQAQKNKVNHILRKMFLKRGETLLDIGCGWGELIITAAKQYGVNALGITLSEEQKEKVKERIIQEKLEKLVDVQLLDYRELKNINFDKIVSVGMLEHVGKQNLDAYFKNIINRLNDGGISLLHCITGQSEIGVNGWINKYIFPGGYIPSVRELINNMEQTGFSVIDMESLRRHYTKTLEHWADNFERALPIISQSKDDKFIKMWRLYLNSCAASFNCGNVDIHQFLFTKGINNTIPRTRDYMYF